MSYGELYSVINQAWASLKEIQLIAQCGRKAAENIRNNIRDDIISKGKKLLERYIRKSTSIHTFRIYKYIIKWLGNVSDNGK